MKNRNASIALVCALIFILILSVQYLKLVQDNTMLLKEEQHYIASSLSYASSMGYGLDLNKVASGDRDSIKSLLYMYEYISNCDAVLRVTGDGNDAVIDHLELYNYRVALRDIVDKSINGNLSSEDMDELNKITEDIKLIYKYVNENDKFNRNKFDKEVGSKLKLKNP